MRWIAALAVTCTLASAAGARTLGSVERVCPFTGTRFSGRIDSSGTRFCTRLDRKPIGPIGSPPEVPVCPDDGFIVFKESFSEAELATLRPWIGSDDYKKLTASETTYFRYAETLRRLGGPSEEVGWRLVQASWQVEREPERYKRYVAAAVRELETGSGETLLLAAELERRTGQFDSARAKLERLQKQPDLSEGVRAVVERELVFVSERDSTRHYAQANDEDRCKELD
jgi:hypothetical protein